MATIELSLLADHLEPKHIKAFETALHEAGSPELEIDENAETGLLASDVDDDLLAEVMDRLDVHDAACDIYVPGHFEEVFEVGGHRIGSAQALVTVLEELKDEIVDEDAEDDEDYEEDYDEDVEDDEEYEGASLGGDSDEPSGYEMKEKELARIWRLLFQGARLCMHRGVCMFVNP